MATHSYKNHEIKVFTVDDVIVSRSIPLPLLGVSNCLQSQEI